MTTRSALKIDPSLRLIMGLSLVSLQFFSHFIDLALDRPGRRSTAAIFNAGEGLLDNTVECSMVGKGGIEHDGDFAPAINSNSKW